MDVLEFLDDLIFFVFPIPNDVLLEVNEEFLRKHKRKGCEFFQGLLWSCSIDVRLISVDEFQSFRRGESKGSVDVSDELIQEVS